MRTPALQTNYLLAGGSVNSVFTTDDLREISFKTLHSFCSQYMPDFRPISANEVSYSKHTYTDGLGNVFTSYTGNTGIYGNNICI